MDESTAESRTSAGGVMIRVPAGSFMMGSPESEDGHEPWEQQREITFVNGFFLGRTPVTQAEYEAIAGKNPTDHEQIANAPVDSMSWEMAHEYCRKLAKRDREEGTLPSGWEYRLPTEAEWEYACRAGSSGPRYGPLNEVAWHYGNAGHNTHPVGLKKANAWGFHDMLGNVAEWCQDWFSKAASARAARGGCYFNSARFCRAAHRWGWRSYPGRYFGFRLLAAREGPLELSPPIDDFPPQKMPPSIYDAIDANDYALALRLITADPAAIDPVDIVPPPLQQCIYEDKPQWIEWLLDHGADIEHREQDYGSTPLTTAIVHRHEAIIRMLVERGADPSGAMDVAQRGLAGAFEDDPRLDREGYEGVVELLRELGIGSNR